MPDLAHLRARVAGAAHALGSGAARILARPERSRQQPGNQHDNEADNAMRWDGRPGHYEVWYLTFNHRDSQTGYWIRYTLEAPQTGHGEPYAQLWLAHFDALEPERNVAINRKLPMDRMSTATAPFSVTMGDSILGHDSARGSLRGHGHQAEWDLSWTPAATTHRHLPSIMYRRGGLGETTVLSPNLDVAITGAVTVDGRRFELDREPGGQTHLWGKKHAHAWAWGHCNAFANRPGAAVELLSVRLKRKGLLLPRMTIFTVYLEGQAHCLNQFHNTLFTGASYSGTRLRFHGRTGRWRFEGEFSCRPEDMVVAPYVDPDGERSYCSNTEVADLHLTVYERRGAYGWREHERLVAPRCAHFEIGGRTRDPDIVADHVTVEGGPP
jgi:hypothetical protein